VSAAISGVLIDAVIARETSPQRRGNSGRMSAYGTKRTSKHRSAMSAFGGKADVAN
jgi:hypothetical protein